MILVKLLCILYNRITVTETDYEQSC